MKFDLASGKRGGQGCGEEALRGLYGELDIALRKDGDKQLAVAFLGDRAQGEIGGREVVGVDRDAVF